MAEERIRRAVRQLLVRHEELCQVGGDHLPQKAGKGTRGGGHQTFRKIIQAKAE